MKKVVYFCFLLLLLASCSRPAWHKTADGVYVYCIANDKYPLKWSGNVVGCLADGDGDLISYKNNGEVKISSTIVDKMLELLCAEEKDLTYKGYYRLCRQLGDTFIEETCDGRPYERNPAIQDLIKYHLYSVPDVLRMNKFTMEMNMKQSRTLAVS